MKKYRTIDAVLNSPLVDFVPPPKIETTDRVLRSTRLEDSIYTDLRTGDDSLEQTERTAAEKLASFPALSRDVFQSFYSLLPRRNDESALSVAARKFNTPILDRITQSDDFPTLKTICEVRELPAYEAAAEFITRTAGELDSLLSDIGGNKNALNTLEKLEQAGEQARWKLIALCQQRTVQNRPVPLGRVHHAGQDDRGVLRGGEKRDRHLSGAVRLPDPVREPESSSHGPLGIEGPGAGGEKEAL